jgi:hypothetical protein
METKNFEIQIKKKSCTKNCLKRTQKIKNEINILQKVSKEFFNKVFKENSRGKKFESKNFIKNILSTTFRK